ncbi:MAG: hypothetical protein JWN30_562 [Bacilli bacterium]|nr:hypothetical protein [Bacilli bacterium]
MTIHHNHGGVHPVMIAAIITSLLFLLAIICTIVPLLPSWIFIAASPLLYGAIAGFQHLSIAAWIAVVLTIALLLLIDTFATSMSTLRVGGTKWAVIGAVIGAILGPLLLTPLLGIFIGPAIGAMAAELLRVRKIRDLTVVAKVGAVSLLSQLMTTLIKLLLVAGCAVVFFYALK